MGAVKFSVLLPTRDREELLKYAVQSVANQTYADWELIVSDNGSSEEEISWLVDCSDVRIRYFKQTHVLSVTENWNFAQEKAQGDYFFMIGDDDALLPETLETVAKTIEQNGDIETLIYPCYVWQQKNVSPSYPEGYLFRMQSVPTAREGIVEKSIRRKWLEDILSFNESYGYNMQYYCYSRNFVKKLRRYGNVYEPPYPDFYFSVMMLYIADRAYFINRPLCIVGVTNKSYGWYFLNDREDIGMEFHKESGYKDKVSKSIRRLLVSVDEMDTAAFVSFNLAVERLGLPSLNATAYYKTVIKRKIHVCSLIRLCRSMKNEMFPNVSIKQRMELIDWFMRYAKHQAAEDEIYYLTNVYSQHFDLDYENILEVINNDPQLIAQKILSSPKKQENILVNALQYPKLHRLYEWLQRIDTESLYRVLKGRKVLIRGAYSRGKIIKNFLLNLGVAVEGYIDKAQTKNFYDGLPLYAPDIINGNSSKYYAICPLESVYDSILDEFTEAGYEYMKDFAYVNYNPKIKAQNYIDIFGNKIYCSKKCDELYVEFLGREDVLKVDSDSIKGNVVMQGNGAYLRLKECCSQPGSVNAYCRGCAELGIESYDSYLTVVDKPNEIFSFTV
ncbi:MAG: glycosyltransferase family 2 protein [Selenomonadaceae bacterium]|nr:glycosyltransferase family 2 protein [Selenomonadaceae bacterium]